MSKISDTEDITDQELDASAEPKRKRFKVKAWHIILLAIAVVATIALAYWQITRFQSGSGTFQNLGYAFQWPLFGAFFVYAFRMGVKYENQAVEAENAADDPDYLYEADLDESGEEGTPPVTKIDEDFLPQRPQIDIETFNELNQPRRGHESYDGLPTTPATTAQKDNK